jgi:hypothetical protein
MAKNTLSPSEAQQAAQALEKLLAAKTISKKHIYFQNFIRGFVFSVGGILGATVGIAILLWFLSLFQEVPLLGDFVQNVQQTITQNK